MRTAPRSRNFVRTFGVATPTRATTNADSDSDLATLERRWRFVGLVILATVSLGATIFLLLFPLGDDGDSWCGNVFQASARHTGVCQDRAQTRLILGLVVGVVTLCLATAATLTRRHQRMGS